MGHLGAILAHVGLQDAPQDRRRPFQDTLKTLPDASETPSRASKAPPRTSKARPGVSIGLVISELGESLSHLGVVLARLGLQGASNSLQLAFKCLQSTPKSLQDAPKIVQDASWGSQFTPSFLRDFAIGEFLGHLDNVLAPLVLQGASDSLQDASSHRPPERLHHAPRTPPRACATGQASSASLLPSTCLIPKISRKIYAQ